MNISIYQYFSWVCLTYIILAMKRQMHSLERLSGLMKVRTPLVLARGATATGGRNVQKIIQILH